MISLILQMDPIDKGNKVLKRVLWSVEQVGEEENQE